MKFSRSFIYIQRALKGALPYLGVCIIIGVYFITAVSMGYFLSLRMNAISWLTYLVAYGTGFGTQLTRCYIVFNGVQDYSFLKGGFSLPVIFALILAIYTGVEAYHLAPLYFISIIGLIGSGFIVEYLFLRSVYRSMRLQVMSNDKEREKIERAYQEESEFFIFTERLEKERDKILDGINDVPAYSPTPSPSPNGTGV